MPYIITSKENNQIIQVVNISYVSNLSNNIIYPDYDSNINNIIFTQYWNDNIQSIVVELLGKTPKQITQYLIDNNLISFDNSLKITDNGMLFAKTNKELYNEDNTNIEYIRNYKSELYEKIDKDIIDYFNKITEGFTNHLGEYKGFSYSNLKFQANEESTTRIDKAISLVDKIYSISFQYVFPTWISNSQDINGNDIRYNFMNYSDLIQFAISMAGHWQYNFIKMKDLKDNKIFLSIEELENYNIEDEWI